MTAQYPGTSIGIDSGRPTSNTNSRTPDAVLPLGVIDAKKGAPVLNTMHDPNEKQAISRISDRLAKDSETQKAVADSAAALQDIQDGLGSGTLTVEEASRLQKRLSGYEAKLAEAVSDGKLDEAEQRTLNTSLKALKKEMSWLEKNEADATSSDASRWAVASDLGRNIAQYDSLLGQSRNGTLDTKDLADRLHAQSRLHETFAKVTADSAYEAADQKQVDKLLSEANIQPAQGELKWTISAIKSNLAELQGILNGVAAGQLTTAETSELLQLFSIIEFTQSKLLQDGQITKQDALLFQEAQTQLKAKIEQLRTNASNILPQDNGSRWELAAQIQDKIDAQQSLLDGLRNRELSGKDASRLLALDNEHTETLGAALGDGSISRQEETNLDQLIDQLAELNDKSSTPSVNTPPNFTPPTTGPGPTKPPAGIVSDFVLDRIDRILQQISLSGTDYSRGSQGTTPTTPQTDASQGSPLDGFDRIMGQISGGNSAYRWVENTPSKPADSGGQSDFFARLDNLMNLMSVKNKEEPKG